ncbi:MAG: SulP family inorganic anion transporter [Gammaproteobacteria bacterium]|nr:SulP family inorganic anion transporter [Gammaproteobacteria bacterium]
MSPGRDNATSLWHKFLSIAPGLYVLLHYHRSWFRYDFAAGLSVAAIALPVGIAYSELVGVPAIIGMYSAIFPLFAYALFGSSKQLMTGPDAATCILVAAALGPLAGGDPERYLPLMVILTLMTGILFILAGMGRLGFIANFLSQPILAGFLNGVAIYIVVGQLPKLLGITLNSQDFFSKIAEIASRLEESHLPTLLLGTTLLAALVSLRRILPRIPAALVVVVIGVVAVKVLDLQAQGVEVIGEITVAFPTHRLPALEIRDYATLLLDAAAIVLISFTSGVLTAKSFARRNRYEIRPDQELVAFGACNIASGLAQGFPVTGADSRTAVNDNMGGKSQLVGIVAGIAMLLVVVFLAGPLASVPDAALAAVIVVSSIGLFDLAAIRELYDTSQREFGISIGTTVGVLVLGVLPGIILAVALSLLWLLAIGSRPHDAVLGRVPGMRGFHDIQDFPEAKTIPGLILYRFDYNVVFFNADFFRDRIRQIIAASDTPVKWVVIDASSVNVIDATAFHKIEDLKDELAQNGIVLAFARAKPHLSSFFKKEWWDEKQQKHEEFTFFTLKGAVRAYNLERKAMRKEQRLETTTPRDNAKVGEHPD